MELPGLDDPGVSIVICNHNHGDYLDRAVSSALGQTHPCEVIVVDDGSTDSSREKLVKWRDRVQVVLQDNGGQRSAYNAGFERCSGDVVIFLDSDDYLRPDAAACVAQAFEAGVVKVHFRMTLVDERDRALGVLIPTILASGDQLAGLISRGTLYGSAPGTGNAYRSSVLRALFPLPVNPDDRFAADFFTIYGCIAFGGIVAIQRPLAAYRVSPETLVGLVFGNAVQQANDRELFKVRSREFRAWLAERTGGTVITPEELVDFSRAKSLFASTIFTRPYVEGVRAGCAELPKLLHAVWANDSFSFLSKGFLSTWAIVVLLSPRAFGLPLARYVSNPASRSAGKGSTLA
jgi:glycosyltransferase involved in cell wall biosynthesis